MSGVEGSTERDDHGDPARALVGALRTELSDALLAVAWYGDGDRGLLYVGDGADAPDGRFGVTLRRRPLADGTGGTFEYAIDAYEEVIVVTLSVEAFSPSRDVAGVALAVERDAPLAAITAAIERAVAAYRRAR